MKRILFVVVGVAALAAALPSVASASQLIDRDATAVKLTVDDRGRAMVTYRSRGEARRVLAWGATDARPPLPSRPQVRFRLDRSGGWKAGGPPFRGTCRRYDGPTLAWAVRGAACKAPDGSYWALQRWQRLLPNYGGTNAPSELRLSHWTGPLAQLQVGLDWTRSGFDHLYGSFTHRGRPVHGFRSTDTGNPLDDYGRNVYLDTFDSAYGMGWRRENSFLTHRGSGAFCYALGPHGDRPAGKGERYRATVIGPGVTPDVMWEGAAPGPFDARRDALAADEIRALGSALCKPYV